MRFNELMSGWVLDVCFFFFCEFFFANLRFSPETRVRVAFRGGAVFLGILQDFLGGGFLGAPGNMGDLHLTLSIVVM